MKLARQLTDAEQAHVLTAVRYLRARFGTWVAVGRAARMRTRTLRRIRAGRRVRLYVAQRFATLASVAVEDLLLGRFPASWDCPLCGHRV